MASPVSTESADVVARCKSLAAQGVTSAASVPSTPPTSVAARLTRVGLGWNDLSTLMKQALLWDHGLVQTDATMLTQVYTSCESDGVGRAMASIGLTKAEVAAAGVAIAACPASTGSYARQDLGSFPLKLTKCAVPLKSAFTSNASVWSQDALGSNRPFDLRVYQHSATSGAIMAIHAISAGGADSGTTTSIGSCPLTPGGLAIPCAVYSTAVVSSSSGSGAVPKWCIPPTSDAMTTWLLEVRATSKPAASDASSSTAAIVLGVLLGVVLLAVGGYWFLVLRKPRKKKRRATDSPGFLGNAFLRHNNQRRDLEPEDEDSYERQLQEMNVGTAAASLKLNAFEHDPCHRILSKGAYGEVWLGSFRGKEVAIKKILHAKRHDTFELECFTEEIRIMAALDHPHIVHLIGFAWDTLTNLWYLVANMELSWDAKLRLAVGTARALAYLHGRSPAVIHRDLKSKNILVSDAGEAKLSDFGISRTRVADETMTVGVGTVYWTAPEVLLGQKYTEQVDIYSFGVVLCELDTHRAPYADMQEVAQMAIAQRVATHQFRPPFSAKCPKLVKDLADRCMAQDPSARPSAQEIVDLIELWKGWKQA
ncbi:TKL/DRK protein kinase [Saprolegnia parasitica CBS 223.65]|uniref:TKL/DRK protein kinase n=1 Tax=Saprolegnia parasitica (strain CBS 223.65) TaxID=695850 RepID=A0A067BMP4_SAPPC|nr:TKL/DRK protein kinase [Saprolegnia parasitica CBS 223.65]KDO19719.1 TKL/DRK protein kinase [Saprolegnia parasitica CBS 223.65]|eukprot:XP_012209578.1 TKL/DRK protein kinase [Saprolegnia parasitica CBS 223.65]